MLEISVVLSPSDRPFRLRWALNALAEQTLERIKWEALLPLQADDDHTLTAIEGHPLLTEGQAHVLPVSGPVTAGAARNHAWRLASGRLVVFVDAELRPPPQWLEKATGFGARDWEATWEGSIEPDPLESVLARSAMRSIRASQPFEPFSGAANVVYPRSVLAALDGWDERLTSAELAGLDLAARALRAGVRWMPQPSLLVYSSIRTSCAERARTALLTSDLPLLVRQHPEIRKQLPLRVFRRRSHAAMMLALAGLATGRRRRAALLAPAPWLLARARGIDRRRIVPGLTRRALEDIGELTLLSWGSVRCRSVLL